MLGKLIKKLKKHRTELDSVIRELRELDASNGASKRMPVSLDEHEKALLVRTLRQVGGNQTEAARILRIGRDRLRYKITKPL